MKPRKSWERSWRHTESGCPTGFRSVFGLIRLTIVYNRSPPFLWDDIIRLTRCLLLAVRPHLREFLFGSLATMEIFPPKIFEQLAEQN